MTTNLFKVILAMDAYNRVAGQSHSLWRKIHEETPY